jgi:tetratricopeptide (TPR) repeat protein
MLALLEKGDTAAAKQQYYIASSLYSLQYDERYETNMAGVFESEGNYIEAEKYYLMAIDKTKGKSIIALQAYFDFLNKDKTTLIVSSETDSLISKQFNIGNQLYELNKDPLVLYRLGQVAISARLNNEAVDYFSRAAKELPLGSPFQKASLRMLSEK